MILRVTNATDGNLTIEALRTSLAAGETKDVQLGSRDSLKRFSAAFTDSNSELSTMLAAGTITVEQLDEVLSGYVSEWTNIAAGATATFTHNLGVDASRMLVDVMANDGALGAGTSHYIGCGGDVDGVHDTGYAITSVTSTVLTVVRGNQDTDAVSIRVRINVQGA